MQATSKSRSNRVLMALVAAWIIVSMAIGGTVSADAPPDQATNASASE